MTKPTKRPAKRPRGDSPSFPEKPPVLPTIPQRYSQHSAAEAEKAFAAQVAAILADPKAANARALVRSGLFKRRADQLESWLPPPREGGWQRPGDPAPGIHRLLADARRHAAARHYLEAAEALAEALRLYWAHEPAIVMQWREADRQRLRARRATQLEHLEPGRQKGAGRNRNRARRAMAALLDRAKELHEKRGWTAGPIAQHFIATGVVPLSRRKSKDGTYKPLSRRQMVRHLHADGIP